MPASAPPPTPAPAPRAAAIIAKPAKVPVVEGHRLLERGFYPMEGSTNTRVEYWIRKRDGMPVTVPFAGPPFDGQHFDKEALDAVLASA